MIVYISFVTVSCFTGKSFRREWRSFGSNLCRL